MLKMPLIFSNHMVLQRQKAVVVWGWSDADAVVNVSLLKANRVLSHGSAIASAEGDWKLTLPALEAECNLTLMIKSGKEEIRYSDVLIGEVWIAGGQSNMQYWMEYDAEKEIELGRAANPNIRFFDTTQIPYEGAMEDYSYTDSGFWRTCDRENLPWFSAVGYYCAVQLEKSLGVPVGIVGCNWGGTRACCWMDESYLRGTAGEIWLTEYEESLKGLNLDEYHRSYRGAPKNVPSRLLPDPGEILLWPGLSQEQQAQMLAMKASVPQPPYAEFIGPDHPWRPCGLYHTMLKKIVPYTARGVLWYQGESDASHPEIYDIVLINLIRNW